MSSNVEKGDFESYLSRYCTDRGLTKEEAVQHALIREIKTYYDEHSCEKFE